MINQFIFFKYFLFFMHKNTFVCCLESDESGGPADVCDAAVLPNWAGEEEDEEEEENRKSSAWPTFFCIYSI